jgi:hypothetical protein
MERWWQSIYWYQYRPTYLVMQDLKNGNGRPIPPNAPLELTMFDGHGWLSEQVDLARVALDELLRRDKVGKLSPKYRRQLDEIALANVSVPVTAPVQYYLNNEISDRLAAGKLTAEQQEKIYQHAVTVTLSTQRLVMQWDDVPIRIKFQTCLPDCSNRGWEAELTYKSVRIDGQHVAWSTIRRFREQNYASLSGRQSTDVDRWVSYTTVGKHRIDLDVQIDIHYGSSPYSGKGPVVRSELHTLTTSFEEAKPTFLVRAIRFLGDPAHEGRHYLSFRWLSSDIGSGSVPLRDLAFTELVRRSRLGELTTDEHNHLVDQLLGIQKNRAQPWNGAFGDYIEGERAASKLPDPEWRQYANHQLGFHMRVRPEIRQGDPLPIELITVARRGNLRVSEFPAAQWNLTCAFPDSAPRCIELSAWHGKGVISPPCNCPDFAMPYIASLSYGSLGRYTVRGTLYYYAPMAERPQNMELPTEYDLGEAPFTIVSRTIDTVSSVNDPALRKAVEQSIIISNLLRWSNGRLTFSINLQRPPVGLAFHASVWAAGKESKFGEIFAEKGSEGNASYPQFDIPDAKQFPSTGLIFKFTPDGVTARESVGVKRYWNEDVTIGGVSIGQDDYLQGRK